MFQDNDDLNIHDDGEDSPVASQGAWPAFSSAPASAGLKPGAGLQVSALGQLLSGHNGNIASMVSQDSVTCDFFIIWVIWTEISGIYTRAVGIGKMVSAECEV